jgi:16S rRNA (adenine1518-N6/adenine1519-N6)-dimethyltransferase
MNKKHFAQVVALAFSQRRKTLRNTLKRLFDIEDIQAVGINPGARAETLTLNEFAQLANVVTLREARAFRD